jgi:hypothetical protein
VRFLQSVRGARTKRSRTQGRFALEVLGDHEVMDYPVLVEEYEPDWVEELLGDYPHWDGCAPKQKSLRPSLLSNWWW